MTCNIYYVVTIVIFLPLCICVGFEYYDDSNSLEDQAENVLNITDTNIPGNQDNLTTYNILKTNISNFTVKYNVKHNHSTDFNRNSKMTFLNFTIKYDFTSPKTKMFSSRKIKDEYEYVYEDEVKHYILRHNMPEPENDTSMNSSGSSLKSPLTEFYNLEPAEQYLNFSFQHNYSKCYSVWYVLKDRPCWNLPLLYGDFGRQIKETDVFLMHGGKLKNVVEDENQEGWKRDGEDFSIPLTYYTNKWCKSSPCFGDHTLCLFHEKEVSSLCTENYIVEVPNISEQIALMNTLNSMRNKIANGESDRYSHLPPAANMKQMIYDYDLENFAKVWLLQCLPGPEPCSSLDETFVNQLECTKYAKFCCVQTSQGEYKKCTPKPECFTPPIIGCLHIWFWNAGKNLTYTDIQCGHTSVLSYTTAQLLWATTYKIGCAYGIQSNGDVRVICNFSPGAPYALDSRLYCGILNLKGGQKILSEEDISDTNFLKSYGINIDHNITRNVTKKSNNDKRSQKSLFKDVNDGWGMGVLHNIYTTGQLTKTLENFRNGTKDMVARLILKYKFLELNGAKCDSDDSIYMIGPPGSVCVERGRRYSGLCYDYRDPTPGYRFVAVIAPIALFSLILYDLFSGIVRQTNY